jgi:hypothetical protein
MFVWHVPKFWPFLLNNAYRAKAAVFVVERDGQIKSAPLEQLSLAQSHLEG